MGQVCRTVRVSSCAMVSGSRRSSCLLLANAPNATAPVPVVAEGPSFSGAAASTFCPQRGREVGSENQWELPKQWGFGRGLVTAWTGHSGVTDVPSGHKNTVFPGDSRPVTSGEQAPQPWAPAAQRAGAPRWRRAKHRKRNVGRRSEASRRTQQTGPPPPQLSEKPKLPAGTMPGGARSGSAARLAHLLLWNPAPQAEARWPDLRNSVLAVEETLLLK